jgi:hypothetical protein
MDFGCEIVLVFGGCSCGGESDTPATIEDKSGDRGSDCLDLGAQTYLMFS